MRVRSARSWASTLILLLLMSGTALAGPPLEVGFQPTLDVIPALLAKDQGLFGRNGIDVTMTAGSGAVQISGVVAGSLQIGNPTVPQLLQAVDSGLDLMIVAGANTLSPSAEEFATVVRAGEALREPRDFIGHKVAVNTVGSFLHVLFVQWLKNHGVDPRQVTFIEVPFPQMADLLRQGTIDAAVTVEPFITRMVQTKTGERQDAFLRDFPAGSPVAVYVADRRWAEAHRDQVQAFRTGLQQGLDVMKAHPDDSRAEVQKYLKMPAEILAALKIPDIAVEVSASGISDWIRVLRGQNLIAGDLDANRLLWR